MYAFDPYNVFLAIATNIPVLLMTVLQGQIWSVFNVAEADLMFFSVCLRT